MDLKILLILNFIYLIQADDCRNIQCDPNTVLCPYKTLYADIFIHKICRGCNICIKLGSPLDGEGCPAMPCPENPPPGSCQRPEFYNSWIIYNGKKCRTCESRLCSSTK